MAVPVLANASSTAVPGHKIDAAPTIDGTVDLEKEWAGVPSFEGLVDMMTGGASNFGGTFYLAYDANYIYFAAKLQDPNPGAIAATEYRTNVGLTSDDHVGLSLDVVGALTEFSDFSMNSRGATNVQLAGGRAAKREWGGEIVSKGRITETGWEAEARIPWQIMRLPGAGTRTLRFNVFRYIPREARNLTWAFMNAGNVSNAGRWENVEVPKQTQERKLQLLPYTYLGWDDKGEIVNGGVDLKTNVTDQIALVGTLNPDFRNIENQILSLDFSRFARLAGDSRPFFAEGASYLETGIYASQRIKSFDAGLNVHGKLTDKLSFGILDAADFGEGNDLVSNFTYNPTPQHSLRGSYTSRTTAGIKNDGYMFRYFGTNGPFSLFARTMGSKDNITGKGVTNNFNLNYQKGHWNAFLGYNASSPKFNPRLGFVFDRNYKGFEGGFGFDQSFNKGPLTGVNSFVYWADYDQYAGGHYRKSFNPSAGFGFRNGPSVNVYGSWDEFFGVNDRVVGFNIGYPRGNANNRISIGGDFGEFAGQRYSSRSVSGSYKPTSKLQLTGSYQVVRHFDVSDQAIIGMNYDLGNDLYLSGRAVKRRKDWNAYLSFRRSGGKGLEYYLILGDPNAPKWRSSIVLKVAAPLDIKF